MNQSNKNESYWILICWWMNGWNGDLSRSFTQLSVGCGEIGYRFSAREQSIPSHFIHQLSLFLFKKDNSPLSLLPPHGLRPITNCLPAQLAWFGGGRERRINQISLPAAAAVFDWKEKTKRRRQLGWLFILGINEWREWLSCLASSIEKKTFLFKLRNDWLWVACPRPLHSLTFHWFSSLHLPKNKQSLMKLARMKEKGESNKKRRTGKEAAMKLNFV